MKKNFELGSSEFAIPEQAKEHYTDEEFKEKQDMYDAIEYEEGIEPDGYVSKEKISKKAESQIAQFKKEKIGHSVFDFVSRMKDAA